MKSKNLRLWTLFIVLVFSTLLAFYFSISSEERHLLGKEIIQKPDTALPERRPDDSSLTQTDPHHATDQDMDSEKIRTIQRMTSLLKKRKADLTENTRSSAGVYGYIDTDVFPGSLQVVLSHAEGENIVRKDLRLTMNGTRFQQDHLKPGRYQLELLNQKGDHKAIRSFLLEPDQNRKIAFNRQGTVSFSGYVLFDQEPLENAGVALFQYTLGSVSFIPSIRIKQETDDTGYFQFEDVKPGIYEVYFYPRELNKKFILFPSPYKRQIELLEENIHTEYNLSSLHRLQGTLSQALSKRETLRIRVTHLEDMIVPLQANLDEGDDLFVFSHVPPGDFSLIRMGPDYEVVLLPELRVLEGEKIKDLGVIDTKMDSSLRIVLYGAEEMASSSPLYNMGNLRMDYGTIRLRLREMKGRGNAQFTVDQLPCVFSGVPSGTFKITASSLDGFRVFPHPEQLTIETGHEAIIEIEYIAMTKLFVSIFHESAPFSRGSLRSERYGTIFFRSNQSIRKNQDSGSELQRTSAILFKHSALVQDVPPGEWEIRLELSNGEVKNRVFNLQEGKMQHWRIEAP
jgi:hypothetical protein